MRATLEFDMPEESDAHAAALSGSKVGTILNDLDERMRGWLRHGVPPEGAEWMLCELRRQIREGLGE